MQHQFVGRSTLFKAAIIIDETSGSSSGGGRRRCAANDAITNNQYHVCLPRDQIYHMPRLPSLVGPANHLQRIQPVSTPQQSAQWQAQVRAVRIHGPDTMY